MSGRAKSPPRGRRNSVSAPSTSKSGASGENGLFSGDNTGANFIKNRVSSWKWGRSGYQPLEYLPWNNFPTIRLVLSAIFVPYGIVYGLQWLSAHYGFALTIHPTLMYVVLMIICAPLLFAFVVVRMSWKYGITKGDTQIAQYWTFNDAAFERKWANRKIPIETLSEAYFAGKVDLRKGGDLLETLYARHEYAHFGLTWEHVRFFLFNLLPETLWHSKIQDQEQVRDHYDRGNDFYNSFLGETMVYTSGIFKTVEDTLEQSQVNKFNLVLNKIQLMPGEKHLDIGCGWGSLVLHAAKYFGSDSTGVTIAREQVAFFEDKCKKLKIDTNKARMLCMDYRDIPKGKYDKITCLEMAEHVGILRFQTFLRQVSDLLEDDGIFYLQIAGLRRAWQFEDFNWGLFMGKYVFPGADASMPLYWNVDQLERAGFEVHSVENIGIHYSATIKRWYDNWMSNKQAMTEKYGERMYRLWAWFLAHSVISPEQGTATCFQIVAHKNRNNYDRKRWIGERPMVGA